MNLNSIQGTKLVPTFKSISCYFFYACRYKLLHILNPEYNSFAFKIDIASSEASNSNLSSVELTWRDEDETWKGLLLWQIQVIPNQCFEIRVLIIQAFSVSRDVGLTDSAQGHDSRDMDLNIVVDLKCWAHVVWRWGVHEITLPEVAIFAPLVDELIVLPNVFRYIEELEVVEVYRSSKFRVLRQSDLSDQVLQILVIPMIVGSQEISDTRV